MSKCEEWAKSKNSPSKSDKWTHSNNGSSDVSFSPHKHHYEEETKLSNSDEYYLFREEIDLINDRIEFLEFCLRLSTEREIWWKLGIDWEDQNFEDTQEYVALLKNAYEKLRWIPLKLNTLMYFNDNESKQIIAEEAKHNVIMKMNETLQALLEYWEDNNAFQLYEGMGVELIESIRKKIVY